VRQRFLHDGRADSIEGGDPGPRGARRPRPTAVSRPDPGGCRGTHGLSPVVIGGAGEGPPHTATLHPCGTCPWRALARLYAARAANTDRRVVSRRVLSSYAATRTRKPPASAPHAGAGVPSGRCTAQPRPAQRLDGRNLTHPRQSVGASTTSGAADHRRGWPAPAAQRLGTLCKTLHTLPQDRP
jgi:hypothetical protein